MSYVPPHLRKQFESRAPKTENTKPNGLKIRDIQYHYWRGSEDDAGDEFPAHNTLNDSRDRQGSLNHVLLFTGANPRWETDRIIFVKSNLVVLPGYREAKVSRAALNRKADFDGPAPQDDTVPADGAAASIAATSESKTTEESKDDTEDDVESGMKGEAPRTRRTVFEPVDEVPIEITPEDPQPVAFFSQAARANKTEGFTFTRYFVIEHIALLAAHSRELTRMLEQKWSKPDKYGNVNTAKRGQRQWEESLSYEWAVIKFKELKGDDVPAAPVVEKAPREEASRLESKRERSKSLRNSRSRRLSGSKVESGKSVNELLAEMRFGNEAGGS